MARYLEWVGCAFGAFLLALNRPYSGWGFVAFLASNGCWIGFEVAAGAAGLVSMQVVMTTTSLLGIYRWMVVSDRNSGFRARKG